MATADSNFLSILHDGHDDCIDKILERLSLDDLCLFSRTCKRLQTLCVNHFRRKYQREASEEVEIVVGWHGNLSVAKYVKYLKYFSNFIKNLKIRVWKWDFDSNNGWISNVENFIKTKCHQNLNRISITGDMELVKFCQEIAEYLRHVEVVQFGDRRKRDRNEANFLNFCSNIKKLILTDSMHVDKVDGILQMKHHQLKHFYYINADAKNLTPAKLKTFFQMNSEIESVGISFSLGDLAHNHHKVKCFQMLDYALNLKHLFLSMNRHLRRSFDDISSHLSLLCERSDFITLEIEIFDECGLNALRWQIKQLATLKQLTKIHLHNITLFNMMPELQSLVHLKVIVCSNLQNIINWRPSDNFNELMHMVNLIDATLPQIEEVQIEDVGEAQLYFCCTYFVRHCMNLKRILVPASTIAAPNFHPAQHIADFHFARRRLPNACQLTIFTSYKDETPYFDHASILVKLKFVEFKSDSSILFQRYTICH